MILVAFWELNCNPTPKFPNFNEVAKSYNNLSTKVIVAGALAPRKIQLDIQPMIAKIVRLFENNSRCLLFDAPFAFSANVISLRVHLISSNAFQHPQIGNKRQAGKFLAIGKLPIALFWSNCFRIVYIMRKSGIST